MKITAKDVENGFIAVSPDNSIIRYVSKKGDFNVLALPDLLEACKKLIMHKNQNNIHPVDFQRIQQAINKAEQ